MKLSEYLDAYDITLSDFSKLTGISYATLHNYKSNLIPKVIADMKKIEDATCRKVLMEDFVPYASSRAQNKHARSDKNKKKNDKKSD